MVVKRTGERASFESMLIANRGEIAIRIARAASELGLRTVSVFSKDDESSLHRRATTESVALDSVGAAAYLDIDRIVDTALRSHCDAVHPGYGFLSENVNFARRCQEAGLFHIRGQNLIDLLKRFEIGGGNAYKKR